MAWNDDFEELSGPRQAPKHPTTPEDFPFESTTRAAWAKKRQDEVIASEAAGNFEGNMGTTLPAPPPGNWQAMFEPVAENSAPTIDWKADFEPVKTPLFSLQGAGSLLRSIGPGIARGILGHQLAGLEAKKQMLEETAKKAAPLGVLGPSMEEITELDAQIKEKQRSLTEAAIEVAERRGDPSLPLEVAQGAVQSVAENAPGVAIALATRKPLGAAAAVTPLAIAGEAAKGHEYAELRTPDPVTGKPKTEDITAAQTQANVARTAEVVFELVPMGYLLKNLGKVGFGEFVKNYLAKELLTELGTTATNKIAERMLTDPDKPIGDWLGELKDELIMTGLVTAVAAPLTGGMARGMVAAGQLGRKEPYTPDQPFVVPGSDAFVGPMQLPQVPAVGAVNDPLIASSEDQVPTNTPGSQELKDLEAQIKLIDPEKVTEAELAESRRVLEEPQETAKAEAIPGAEIAWSQLGAPKEAVGDASELGASSRQAANAVNYVNPNTGDRLDRVITIGPEGYEGKTPRQMIPKPGTYTLGEFSDDRPEVYMRPLHATIEQWRSEFMPDSTFVISNEQIYSNSALGWHYPSDGKSHMIVPAVLRAPSRGVLEYNPNTQASAFYNATHEFGHALILNRFFGAVDGGVAAQVRTESQAGLITSSQLLPEGQRAVVLEYNSKKARVMDGTMTAQEFLLEWMGPAKIARQGKAKGKETPRPIGENFLKDLGVAPQATAKTLIAAMARRAADESRIPKEMTKIDMRRRMSEELLSIDEYLADQVSRFAYKRNWDSKSPLGQFFKEALDSLRRFFIGRKAEGIIAPGVAFEEWMDGLSRIDAAVDQIGTLVKNKKRAGKPKTTPVVKTEAKPKQKKAKTKVKRAAHNVSTDTTGRIQKRAFSQITFLQKAKAISEEQAKEMKDLVNREAWDLLAEKLSNASAKNVKHEFDDVPEQNRASRAGGKEAVAEWAQKKFESRFFKAWFGDWQNNPSEASIVRLGAFEQRNDGTIAYDKETPAMPLVMFMSLERIKKGANVFHASTAQSVTFTEASAEETLDPTLVPVVLNIRNPYIVEDTLSPAPPVSELASQGFDGIVYPSEIEGAMSYVVFNPEQIKVVDSRNPYPPASKVRMETDFDQSTNEGTNASKFFNGVKNYLLDSAPLKRALKWNLNYTKAFQMQQLAWLNPDLSDLTWFVEIGRKYSQYRASRQVNADHILNEWSNFSRTDREIINKILLAHVEGKKLWYDLHKHPQTEQYEYLMSQTALDEMKKHGVDINTEEGKQIAGHVLRVQNDLLGYLNEDERILQKLLAMRLGHNPRKHFHAVRELAVHIHNLRKQPFFPQGRFGNMMLIVRRQREDGAGYEVVWREAFEDEREWKKAEKNMRAKKRPDETVSAEYLSAHEYVLMSLPKEFLTQIATELDLKPEQVDVVAQLIQPIKKDKMLSDFDLERFGVKGYSSDAKRSYANFTWHHSNLQAKTLHRADFNLSINAMERLKNAAEVTGNFPEIKRLTKLHRAMQDARDYTMAPGNEAQTTRAAVSIAYLWANPKTALLNLYGLITVHSDLMQKYGPVEAQKRFARASWMAMMSITPTDLNGLRKAGLSPEIIKGLERAIQEGVLTQSYAYHVAGSANQSSLVRNELYDRFGKWTQKGIDAGMYPFRLTELSTRRVSFIAALEDHMTDKTIGFDQAYSAAVAQTNRLQNDYSLTERVPFMRAGAFGLGPIGPLFTIFGSFAQHMAYHGLGGYEIGHRRKVLHELTEKLKAGEITEEELKKQAPKLFQWGYGYTARIWLITLMLAGYEGLPIMENILDALEMLWRVSGGKKPFRHELRQLVQSVGGNPEQWSRGLGHNAFGFDVSRSLGFGSIFPGTRSLARSTNRSPEEMIGSGLLDMMGPLGGVAKWAFYVGDKGLYKGMQYAPGAIGNVWTAAVWGRDGVRGPSGGLIIQDEEGKPREPTTPEVYGKALGFNPTAVSEAKERFYVSHDWQMYIQSKKTGLLRDFTESDWRKDPEKRKLAKEAISEFNEWLPPEWKKLRITPADTHRAIQSSRRARKDEEAQRPRQKKYQPLYEEIRQGFEPEGSDR